MRPLPPFTVRPLKRRDEPKSVLPASALRERAQAIADEMSIKAGRLSIKATPGRDKPKLRELERPSE